MEQEEHWWKGASVSQKRKNRKAEKLKSRKEEKQRNRKSRKAEQSSRNPQAKGQTKRKTKNKKKQKKNCASGWRMRWCSASVMTRYAWQKVRIPQTVSFSVFHYFQHTETHKCYHKRDHARTASVTSPQPAVEEVKPYLLCSNRAASREAWMAAQAGPPSILFPARIRPCNGVCTPQANKLMSLHQLRFKENVWSKS